MKFYSQSTSTMISGGLSIHSGKRILKTGHLSPDNSSIQFTNTKFISKDWYNIASQKITNLTEILDNAFLLSKWYIYISQTWLSLLKLPI